MSADSERCEDGPVTPVEFLTARLHDVIATARAVQAQAVTDGIDPVDPRLPQLSLAAYVLADIAAKRAIIAAYREQQEFRVLRGLSPVGTPRVAGLEFAVEALCRPFADHPDFDPAWLV